VLDRKTQTYKCEDNEVGATCNSSDDCNFLASDGYADQYECSGGIGGKCVPWCASDADCPAGASCKPFFNSMMTSLMYPGYCAIP
jgi:Cys-rich repeat protein